MTTVHIVQPCRTPGCSMRVETLLDERGIIPVPRLCVSCESDKSRAGRDTTNTKETNT